jgi:dipeptidyl aminopeptidase/acylaminoacyl peptidase
MGRKRSAPYGTWPSPWTAERISSAEVRAGEVRLDGGDVYWLERRPAEGGRSVVVRRDRAGRIADAIPATANARNAVYEYGGGSYAVSGGDVFYTDFGDQRVWIAPAAGGAARPLTAPGPWRFADLTIDPARRRLYAIQEDRSPIPGWGGGGSTKPEPTHRVVAIDLDAGPSGAQPEVLVEGDDFYASPAPSADGSALAWISWRHPDMPWDRTELWIADVNPDGSIAQRKRVAGGDRVESIREPRFSPRGALCFVSDRTGFWNLYRRDDADRITPLTALEAEVGGPQWVFGESYYAFAGEDDVVLAASHGGMWRLHRLRAGVLEETTDRFTDVRYVQTDGERVIFAGASPVEPSSVATMALRGAGVSADVEILRRSSEVAIDLAYVSRPRSIELETAGGDRAHGFFYAPAHAEIEGPAGERPPLMVLCHGGPTSAASTALAPGIQFWTSRGFAVIDLDYRGSTGFGRAYREKLYGQWGVAEVDDCVAAVRHLAAAGEIDPRRAVIRGASAGGYTTLAALAFRDIFRAGASYFGVGDLEALARDTHKFESRYLDRLVGPYPARRDLYVERSPLHAADRLSCPVIFFQGLEDKVVPPNQAETMVEALRRKGIPVAYVPFAGEQHGFRRAENIRRALECELYFYSRVFSFALPDPPPALDIENLDGLDP